LIVLGVRLTMLIVRLIVLVMQLHFSCSSMNLAQLLASLAIFKKKCKMLIGF